MVTRWYAFAGMARYQHANDSAYILVWVFRRLPNPGSIRPRAIKLHTGTYLKEDTIERANDDSRRS